MEAKTTAEWLTSKFGRRLIIFAIFYFLFLEDRVTADHLTTIGVATLIAFTITDVAERLGYSIKEAATISRTKVIDHFKEEVKDE